MGYENFAGYIEVDPNSRIAKTPARVTGVGILRNEDAYVYKDKTVAYFSGDFVHCLTVKMTAGTEDGRVYVWGLTNSINDMKGIDVGGGSYLGMFFYKGSTTCHMYLEECSSGSLFQDSYTITLNTTYYLKIVRDESVGTYGTLYCYVYSDSSRTTLVDTLQLTLNHSKKDFRYIFAMNTWNNGTTETCSGYCENLDLFAEATPAVSTQAMTSIVTTTATGNGNIISLGIPAATQHGHCWSTTINPTTIDSKTENGAPGATGVFTSSLTSLTEDTKYFVRAYATNSQGTVYGNQVSFIAGTTGSAVVFPIDDVMRASSIRHIFRPGFFRMQVGLGDLGFDVDVAEATVRSELEQEYVPLPGAKESIEEALAKASEAAQEAVRKERARRIEEALASTPLLQAALEKAREAEPPAPRPTVTGRRGGLVVTPTETEAEARRRRILEALARTTWGLEDTPQTRTRATRGWTG